jgi:hypothetical protein
MDAGKVVEPYDDGNWETVLGKSEHAAVKLLFKARTWIERPGKTPIRKSSVTPLGRDS